MARDRGSSRASAARRQEQPAGAAGEDRRNVVERLITRDLDEREGVGRRFSERALHAQRSLEDYLRAGVRPRWMERLIEIDRGTKAHERRIAAEHRALREACAGDPDAFAARWTKRAHAFSFDELNQLIRQHNDWYPIERDLPMDPRTRDYVLISGRSYRRTELGPQWVLERFPPRLGD